MGKYKKISVLLPTIEPVGAGSIYIYRITSKKSGHYYIGQTENIKQRAYRHFQCIKNTIAGMINYDRVLPFHVSLSESLKGGRNIVSIREADELIYKYISFDILFVADSKQKADEYEYAYISIHKRNSLCLNKRYS